MESLRHSPHSRGNPVSGYKTSSSLWTRFVSFSTCMVCVYVHIVYGAIEPANKFWEERKAAAEKLRNGGSERSEDSSPAKVAVPQRENTLLAQLPSLDLNILSNSIPKLQNTSGGVN